MRNDSIDEVADPNLSLSDESADVSKNGRHGNSSRSQKHPFKKLLFQADDSPENHDHETKKEKTEKITDRLGHEKSGKLLQPPKGKGHHISHLRDPPKILPSVRKKQYIITISRAQAANQG